ncbi:aspartate racemase [Ruminococcaceae bacterium YRB3002]|nr:aspartate racemase [Ruminococcaceae bacterium YRB3002]
MSLGIIGGMGPMATAVFYEKIVDMTDAATDQEHIDTIIYSCPQIPDRTAFFLGRSTEDPYPRILELAKKLEEQKVDVIAIPCITAAFFEQKLREDISVPVYNGIEQTASLLRGLGIKKAGILATEGSIKNRLIADALLRNGITPVEPDDERQKIVTEIIYDDVKAGREVDMDKLDNVADHLKGKGAEAYILGCTELSVVAHQNKLEPPYFDILDILAMTVIEACGKSIKTEQ